MPTSLGGGSQQGLRIWVKNNAATAGELIKRGTVVNFTSTPTIGFLDLAGTVDYGSAAAKQLIPYITVDDAPADSTTDGGAGRLGVAATDIPYGGYGEVIVYGLAQCLANGADIVAGDIITCDSDGEVIDAANVSHANPFGVGLETGVANQLCWCFVNFIGSSAGATGNSFMGLAF